MKTFREKSKQWENQTLGPYLDTLDDEDNEPLETDDYYDTYDDNYDLYTPDFRRKPGYFKGGKR